MAQNSNINFLKNLSQKLKDIKIDEITENLKDIKVDDLKNINYKRLLYDIRRSRYAKPTFGFLSATLFLIFILLPKIELLKSSIKKAKQYQNESIDLPKKKAELKKENLKIEEIKTMMKEVNSSFIKNEQIIFISQLLNEASKKSNIEITYFAPILKAESSKLCKNSFNKKNSKNFKSKRKKQTKAAKGSLQNKYYDVKFKANYLDIIQFLKEIQLYNVTIIPYCLEVNSNLEILKKTFDKTNNDSFLIPLNNSGLPIDSNYKIDLIDNYPNLGQVFTRIVFKIPTYAR